jgi:hypothetical protein
LERIGDTRTELGGVLEDEAALRHLRLSRSLVRGPDAAPGRGIGFLQGDLRPCGQVGRLLSPILHVQGTRREGCTEFSLRVEGDLDICKPGSSYHGKWPAVALVVLAAQ